MPTQQVHNERTGQAAREMMEATMNESTARRINGDTWHRRASAGVAVLALVGAISVGIIRGSREQQAARAPAPAADIAVARPRWSEAFGRMKAEQAEQRASGDAVEMTRPSVRAPRVTEAFIQMKAEQAEQRAGGDAAETTRPSIGAPRTTEAFGQMKAEQAEARLDRDTDPKQSGSADGHGAARDASRTSSSAATEQ